MRVLFLSAWYPWPRDNGSKIRVYYLLRALQERHHVHLVSFAFGTARPQESDKLGDVCADVDVVAQNPFDRRAKPGILGALTLNPTVDEPVKEMSELVDNVLRQNSYDAIVCSTTTMAFYALMDRTTPKVLEEHNAIAEVLRDEIPRATSQREHIRRWLSWRRRRLYDSRLLGQFDLCTMVSTRDAKAVRKGLMRRGARVEVVPNGVDCSHNSLGIGPPIPNDLVYAGSLTYGPNLSAVRWFLYWVYPIIRRSYGPVRLTVTGSLDGVKMERSFSYDHVRLTGYVEDIRPIVRSSSIAVVPVRFGGGTRLKILEAMALGTPVVSTTKGAEGLEVIDGEDLLIADDPETFARQTIRLLEDAALRERLVKSARRRVEQCYDWAAIGDQFADLVEQTAMPSSGGLVNAQ